MHIQTENDINGASARWLRERAGLDQASFWRSVCATPPSGCNYEQEKTNIPHAIRRLIYLTYVAHLPTDASTKGDSGEALRAGEEYHVARAGGRVGIGNVLNDVANQLKKASRALGI